MVKFAGVALVMSLPVTLGVLINTRAPQTMEVAVEHPLATESRIAAPGRVEGATPEIELRSQCAGRITQIMVEEGQVVKKGQTLLRLDDEQLRYEVEAAVADVELAESQLERLVNGARAEDRAEAAALYEAKRIELERAQRDWQRNKLLLEKKAIARQAGDLYRTRAVSLAAEVAAAKARYEQVSAPARADEVRSAKARILAAKARLDQSKVVLDRMQLKAPCDAQVLKLNVEPGELAGPNSVQPAIVVADTAEFCVRVFVEELDAPRVVPGMVATIVADGLPNAAISGKVAWVSPRMSRKTLWSDEPEERFDTKVREVLIRLNAGVPALIVGLRVDALIDSESAADDSRPRSKATEVLDSSLAVGTSP